LVVSCLVSLIKITNFRNERRVRIRIVEEKPKRNEDCHESEMHKKRDVIELFVRKLAGLQQPAIMSREMFPVRSLFGW